jgi:hypothetical protein
MNATQKATQSAFHSTSKGLSTGLEGEEGFNFVDMYE